MAQQTNPDLAWMKVAKSFIGLKEIVGPKHNPTILEWLNELGAWWREDETPWCGVFTAICLKRAGFKRGTVNSRSKNYVKGSKSGPGHYPYNWYGAGEYKIEGGVKLSKPCYGCVAVKARKGGNHVTFVLGRLPDGRLACIGGNQSNSVSVIAYKESDFDAFMWYGKTANPSPHRYELPVENIKVFSNVSES